MSEFSDGDAVMEHTDWTPTHQPALCQECRELVANTNTEESTDNDNKNEDFYIV